MVKIGLVGVGYWGKNLLRVLKGLKLLHSICEVEREVLNSSLCSGVKTYTKYSEFISDEELDAVVIATPAAMHYEMALSAIKAGKDVFVEKPLSLRLKDGMDLVEKAKKYGRILMVGHILQYHPAILKLKEMISKGVLGKIQYIYSSRLNIGKLRVEENILWSFAPHDISVILMLAGGFPAKISAFAGNYLSQGIYDTSLTNFEFKNGIKGHIFVSWLHPFKEQKLVVIGSNAMAVFDDVSNEKLKLYKHIIEWQEGRVPVAHKAPYEVINIEEGEPLVIELKHFSECVEKRGKPLTDGREGIEVLKFINECERLLSSAVTRLWGRR